MYERNVVILTNQTTSGQNAPFLLEHPIPVRPVKRDINASSELYVNIMEGKTRTSDSERLVSLRKHRPRKKDPIRVSRKKSNLQK